MNYHFFCFQYLYEYHKHVIHELVHDFLNKVMKLNLKSIYPNNSDAYVEFKTNDKLSLYSPVIDTKLVKEQDGQYRIDLLNKSECCMSIFSSPNLTEFIHQILKQFNEFKPADILQTLKVPSSDELDNIINEGQEKHELLVNYQQKTTDFINEVIKSLIL